MSNPLIGEKEIKICGDLYTLRPTFEGLIEIEKRAGCSIAQLSQKIMIGISGINDVTSMVYGGIFGYTNGKPDITFNKLGNKIMKHGMVNLLGDCGQFIAAAISGKNMDDVSDELPDNDSGDESDDGKKKKDTDRTPTDQK